MLEPTQEEMTLDPKALEAAAKASFDDEHCPIGEVWEKADRDLREYWLKSVSIAILAYLQAAGLVEVEVIGPTEGSGK